MLGEAGYNEHSLKYLLHSQIWITPCGAVLKGNHPHGRIIHDNSYAYNYDVSLTRVYKTQL